MILLIDNYDSFSYNLYQLVCSVYLEHRHLQVKDEELDAHIRVIRNDEMTIEQIRALKPEAIILSPGPGKPQDAGVCIKVVTELAGTMPIMGVCLGHQAICEAYDEEAVRTVTATDTGGVVSYAPQLMHGKTSQAKLDNNSRLFKSMPQEIQIARYHSLIARKDRLPQELTITAETSVGEIMAVEHREYPVYGLQFHPESILTPDGRQIMKNFMEVIDND